MSNNYWTAGRVEVPLFFDFSDDGDQELELEVSADYRPARAARVNCSNDDADPGDPAEWQIVEVKVRGGGHLAEMLWKGNEAFEEAVGEALLEDWEESRTERAYARAGYP
jgi:hypothetical protein